ncbi:PIN domain-containing protein [Sulfuritalea sp.]|uniref:PIN domain-containing protein n=1 Tax=Sulfuritalea sp. TaxID=2480090 RepID=UPI00286E5038|nr:PIN domain-containing protein [Sulfuritalea sp.]
MRIFLDANILFSAARADGAVRQLLALCEGAGHELWADAYVFEEARRNPAAKTPAGLPVLNAMAARISIGGLIAGNSLLPDTLVLPEKDRPVLAAAIHHRCDILVTGDRTHFGPLYGTTIRGVTVLSPAMLAEALLD